MNPVLDLKKRRLQRDREQQKVHVELSARLTPAESEKELQGFSRFLTRKLLKVYLLAGLVCAGLWIVDAYACGEMEQESIEIRTVPRI